MARSFGGRSETPPTDCIKLDEAKANPAEWLSYTVQFPKIKRHF
jgi:hypothetical protein